MNDIMVSMQKFISHFSEQYTIYYAFSTLKAFTGKYKTAGNSTKQRSDRPFKEVRPAQAGKEVRPAVDGGQTGRGRQRRQKMEKKDFERGFEFGLRIRDKDGLNNLASYCLA